MKCSVRKFTSAVLAAVILVTSALTGGSVGSSASDTGNTVRQTEAEIPVSDLDREADSEGDGNSGLNISEVSDKDDTEYDSQTVEETPTDEQGGNAGGVSDIQGGGTASEIQSSETTSEMQSSETTSEMQSSETTSEMQSGETTSETQSSETTAEIQSSETASDEQNIETAPDRQEAGASDEQEIVDAADDDQMAEAGAGVSVVLKDSGIAADKDVTLESGEAAVLQVHAFNRLEISTELKLYFWDFDGELPERKELWRDLLTDPCTDIRTGAKEEAAVTLEFIATDGSRMEGCAYHVQDKIADDVIACYLFTELPPGTEADFEVSVSSEADERIAVVPVIADDVSEKYFDELYLTWRSADNSKTEITEAEFMTEDERNDAAESKSADETENGNEFFLERAEGTERLNPSDFGSMRLIVLASEQDMIIDPEHVIADYGNIYLLQYNSAEQSMNAYMYYTIHADAVEPDTVVEAAAETLPEKEAAETLPEEAGAMKAAENQNSITALSQKADSSAAKTTDMLIALVDTGVSEGANVIDRVSLIDDVLEGNGHGNKMAAAITSQNPGAGILSIRAVGDNGRGTVSSVIAAIEYAMKQHAGIINLSIYAKKGLANSVLESEIQKAVSMGIHVVGAAGNNGADASGYMPGSVEAAWIIGACDGEGVRRNDSNYGTTVDYYVAADSTSEAAAKFCGYISANGMEKISDILGNGLIFKQVSGMPETDAAEGETDSEAEDFILAAVPSRFKIQDGSPAWAPEVLRSGRASTHKRKAVFGSEEKWAYCLEPLKGPPTHDTEFNISSAARLGSGDPIAKALYYLYGGPAWGKDVNGINLKTIMTDAGCSSGNNYYAITHYVVAYFYLDGDASKWNAHPEGPGVLNSAGVGLVTTLAGYIRNMPNINDATASLSASSVSAYYDGTKNIYVSQPITYHTFSGNTARIPLPAGISLVNESTGSVTFSGKATIAGGNTFHFEAASSPCITQEYTMTCTAARDFQAYRKNFSGAAQDMGFVYYSDDTKLNFSVEWPLYGYIEIEKHDANTGTSTPTDGYSMDGAQYGIYNSEGAWISSLEISNGRAVSGALTQGTYTVRETAAPEHYDIDITSYNVTVLASQTVKIVSADIPIPVKVKIRKISTASEDILNLSNYTRENAEFGIYADRDCMNKLGVLTTDGQGMTDEFTLPLPDFESPAGITYYVREEKAPSGHKLNSVPAAFTVAYPEDAGRTIMVEICNDPEFTAADAVVEKLNEKGNRIEGVQFEACFYDSDKMDTGKLMKTWILESDTNGEVRIDDDHKVSGADFYVWENQVVIPKGYLTIREIRTPARYMIDNMVHEWDTCGKELTVKTVYNKLEPGKITLRKFDADGKTSLAGVTFELKFLKALEQSGDKTLLYEFLLDEGEAVQLTTDEQGEVVFDNLDQGEYQITEISTTEGHTLLNEPICISLPITMTAEEADAQKNIDLSKAKLNSGYDDKYYFFDCTYEITNSYNFKIPTTGAAGDWKYGYIGIVMLALFCAVSVVCRRRRGPARL